MKKVLKFTIGFFTIFLIVFFAGVFIWSKTVIDTIENEYLSRESAIIKDRNGIIISIEPNNAGYYSCYLKSLPDDFENLLLQKEDKYFYYHLGINPVSTLRALWNKIASGQVTASSTITQQLAKILLNKENDRNIKNKIKEMFYALALEMNYSKEEILLMYGNSVFLGNNIQGFDLGSQLYFGSSLESLTQEQMIRLLATLSMPTSAHPFSERNDNSARNLAQRLNLNLDFMPQDPEQQAGLKNNFKDLINKKTNFELQGLGIDCQDDCKLSLDAELNEKIREILDINLQYMTKDNATHGAVVVLKYPENELLAIAGSPDPRSSDEGYQINMALRPRPIGSTVKPFIYTKGFELGLRPYSKVIDKEYKYSTAEGYAFYPKNYDYEYRGLVNLHYSLSNSLNVPTVKVLEFIGLENFYEFIEEKLKFTPIQDLHEYQYGIALGHLEMDLLHLSYYFSVFANGGYLKPLYIDSNPYFANSAQIFHPAMVQLMNKILTDRQTGIDQFSMVSDLNLPQTNIALKTGTSREYHDSWIIGYTPDFLVGVWVGNTKNLAMKGVSGQTGAGKIWHEVMNLMINSKYNLNTPFNYNLITEVADDGDLEFGLPGDNIEKYANLLMQDNDLISSPHDGDIFLWKGDTQIPLHSKENASWYIDDEFYAEGLDVIFEPRESGNYRVKAQSEEGEIQEIEIILEEESE